MTVKIVDIKTPRTTVDISAIEIENKLPHWLSPQQRYKPQIEAIRKKHRDAYLAKRKAAKIAEDAGFDPNQPRDKSGKWSTQNTRGTLLTPLETFVTAKHMEDVEGSPAFLGTGLQHNLYQVGSLQDRRLAVDGMTQAFKDVSEKMPGVAKYIKDNIVVTDGAYDDYSVSMSTLSHKGKPVAILLNTNGQAIETLRHAIVNDHNIINYAGDRAKAVLRDTGSIDKALVEYFRLSTLHEIAHVVDNMHGGSLSRVVGDQVMHAADGDLDRMIEIVERSVSQYARSQPAEFFAEAFSRVMAGDKIDDGLSWLTTRLQKLAKEMS
jgi:hypothetical protein